MRTRTVRRWVTASILAASAAFFAAGASAAVPGTITHQGRLYSATDNAVKIDLSFRAAEIYQDKLSQPHRAFRSYERVLTVDPKNERAARALIPIYERDEKWNRLPALYEVLLPGGTEGQRLEILLSRRRRYERKKEPEPRDFRGLLHVINAVEVVRDDPPRRTAENP